MIAHIKEMSVKRKAWLDEKTFNEGVALCQSIPGATAMQTAAYVGLKTGGTTGALAAYIGFGLPAFVLMLVLSALYIEHRSMPVVSAVFSGLQVIVVSIVAHAAYSFGRGSVKTIPGALIALVSSGLLMAGVSPFTVIAASATAGALFLKLSSHQGAVADKSDGDKNSSKWSALPMLALMIMLLILYLGHKEFFNLAVTMIKIDLFAFGGGFASLPLMLHEVVTVEGWMDSKTFMDGIALGQITPGPIVITAAFVGYVMYGIAGAAVATIAVFAPSLLILTASAPVFERFKISPFFQGAIKGILASFAGLLLFVALKFALAVPWDIIRVLFVVTTFIALLRKVDTLYIVLAGAILSLVLF